MKKIFYILVLMIFLVGCDSITLKGEHGSVQIRDSYNYKRSKSKGRALGHKNPKNPHYPYYHYHPHYKFGVSGDIDIDF